MLYLLGGSPRAGKTMMSKQFLKQTGVPYLGLDFLKMGISRGLPEYGVDPNGGDLVIAKQIWPVVKGMVVTLFEEGEDYMLEGTYLLPEYVVELQEMMGDVIRSCFVGYAEMDTWEKVGYIRAHAIRSGNKDWSSEDDTEAYERAEFLKQFSVYIRDECEKYGLKYFESESDHQKTITNVVQFLSG